MVDPRMAQATALHTKIATIAIIRFNMVVCAPTLSAALPTYLDRLVLSSTFYYKVSHLGRPPLLSLRGSFPLFQRALTVGATTRSRTCRLHMLFIQWNASI